MSFLGAMALCAGCDPPSVIVEGTLSLGAGVSPAAFGRLAVRLLLDAGGAFDPAAAIPRDAFRADAPLGRLTFPHSYSIESGIDTAPKPNWRVVAWLSRRTTGDQIDPGDVYATMTFVIPACGWLDGYCGTRTGLDGVLGIVAPK